MMNHWITKLIKGNECNTNGEEKKPGWHIYCIIAESDAIVARDELLIFIGRRPQAAAASKRWLLWLYQNCRWPARETTSLAISSWRTWYYLSDRVNNLNLQELREVRKMNCAYDGWHRFDSTVNRWSLTWLPQVSIQRRPSKGVLV